MKDLKKLQILGDVHSVILSRRKGSSDNPKIILGSIIIMMVLATLVNGQNNLDFETWVINSQGLEEPEFWKTNNIQNYLSVSKSTNSSSGNYSALIKSNGISFEGRAPGILQTKWSSLSNPLQNISYDLKIDSLTNNAEAKVISIGFVDGSVLFSDTATYTVVTSGWVNEILILSDASTTCDSVQVSFIANTIATPTGYVGYSEFLVDNISLNQPLSTMELNAQESNIHIYPKPTKDVLQIEVSDNTEIESIELFDLGGKRVKTFNNSDRNLNISDLSSGTYFLRISTTKGGLAEKVIIE